MPQHPASLPPLRHTALSILLALASLGAAQAADAPAIVPLHAFSGAQLGKNPSAPPAYNPADQRLYGIADDIGAGTAYYATLFSLNPLGTEAAQIDFKSNVVTENAHGLPVTNLVRDSKNRIFYGADNRNLRYLVQLNTADLTTTAVAGQELTGFSGLPGQLTVAADDTIYYTVSSGNKPRLHAYDGTTATERYSWSDFELTSAAVLAADDGYVYGVADAYSLSAYYPDYWEYPSSAIIYRMRPDGSNYEIIKTFDAASGYPTSQTVPTATASVIYSGIVDGSDGWLYGTTYRSGLAAGTATDKLGRVYRISKTASEDDTHAFEILHTFAGGTADGSAASGTLIQAGDGNIYGTTQLGGTNDAGTLYRIVRTDAETGAALDTPVYELLSSFTAATQGKMPVGLSTDASTPYTLYGATWTGGTSDAGVLFRIDLPTPVVSFTTPLTVSSEEVSAGDTISLSWAAKGLSEDATCTASGDNGGVWTGAQASASDGTNIGPLSKTGTNTFILTCANPYNSEASSEVSVTVTALPDDNNSGNSDNNGSDSDSDGGGGGGGALNGLLALALGGLLIRRRRQG